MSSITKEISLQYHRLNGKPGKLGVIATKPLETQEDLSLAYSPGVAYPVLEIERQPELVYEYTNKGNLVAVVTNGTAILGLGDRGALASKPVMEGKAVLFKKFADVDSIDIELNSHDPDTVIKVTAAIACSFGGINLEDIKSPSVSISKQLISMLISRFSTMTSMELRLSSALPCLMRWKYPTKDREIKIVFCGAGAAAIASANHW